MSDNSPSPTPEKPAEKPEKPSFLHEQQIMEYLEVLERTSFSLTSMIPAIEGEANREMLARDVEVLLELRERVWRQFTPVFVDVLN